MNANRIHTIPTPTITRREGVALCLLVALATVTTGASAREIKLAAADGPSCQEAHHDQPASSPAPAAAPAATSPGIKPSLHSDTIRGGRLQSPRWHSFLPGMFR